MGSFKKGGITNMALQKSNIYIEVEDFIMNLHALGIDETEFYLHCIETGFTFRYCVDYYKRFGELPDRYVPPSVWNILL